MMQWLLLLSDIFSIITVILCLVLKVPQIIHLVKSREAAGLSTNALLLELSSYTVTLMYNYTNRHALLSYLEYPIIIIQEYVLIGFVMHYKNFNFLHFVVVMILHIGICLAFALNILTKFILTLLLPLTTPMSAISKIMQLLEITSKKNADSVSILTWFLSFFTNATRIYTVYMDSADLNLILNFSVSSVLSGAVMVAAIYYQKLSSRRKVR